MSFQGRNWAKVGKKLLQGTGTAASPTGAAKEKTDANYLAGVSMEQLAGTIKARWSCEQAHQQMNELGLDHFEEC